MPDGEVMDLSTERLREVVASVEPCDVYPDLSADALGVLSHAAIELLRIREAQAGLEPVEVVAAKVRKRFGARWPFEFDVADLAAALQRERDAAAARNAPRCCCEEWRAAVLRAGQDSRLGPCPCPKCADLMALMERTEPHRNAPQVVNHGTGISSCGCGHCQAARAAIAAVAPQGNAPPVKP